MEKLKFKRGEQPQSSQAVLRRLIVLFGILMGIIVYSTGWRITGIDLEETKNENRRDSLQRAMSELLSPDLLDHDSESEFTPVSFMKDCPEEGEVDVVQPVIEEGAPYVVFSTYCAARDEIVTVEGFGFHPESTGKIYVIRSTGNRQPLVVSGKEKAVDNSIFDIDNDGTFSVGVIVPNLRGSAGDIVDIEVHAAWQTSTPYASETTKDVMVKIIETVFLALMATTSAIPIAVVISFTSARNLMRQVRLPLGETLVGFILAPVGFVLGSALIGPLADLGVEVFGKADSAFVGWILTLVAIIGAFGLFTVISRFVQGIELNPTTARLRDLLLNVLLLITVIFTLGAVSSLMIELGTILKENEFYHFEFSDILTIQSTDLGRVLTTLGEIFQMTLSFFAAVGGLFLLVGFGSSSTSRVIGKVRGQESHIMGGVLGIVGGATLMMLAAELGSIAPLLIVIPPVAVTFLAIPVMMRLYDQLMNDGPFKPGENGMGGQTARIIVQVVGGLLIFVLAADFLEMVKIITRERIPETLTWQEFSLFGTNVVITEIVVKAGLMGAVFGGVGGAMAGTHSLFPLGNVIYFTSRTILNAMRSIEPLIMGIVFVIWVSAGPFAGVLALGLHSIAALGKLYSEQIESIDTGPIEAIQATGANRLQTIVYAVIPQIVPSYIAFTMYRWDINVRMSTIIGFVGGGGIGFLLQQQINLLRYKQAGVAVLAIAIVVSILDYASATIRERIV
jgi:phosphonate ABC transporter permease subunit PhnE